MHTLKREQRKGKIDDAIWLNERQWVDAMVEKEKCDGASGESLKIVVFVKQLAREASSAESKHGQRRSGHASRPVEARRADAK